MKGNVRLVRLCDIAELNPRLGEQLSPDTAVSFVPMAALSERATTATGGERLYSDVSKGYTPFLDGDLLVAKITPCFENGKIARAVLSQKFGFGSTEFHVIRTRKDQIDSQYLLHFLRQHRIRREGQGKMTGSAGQRRVPESFLASLEIPIVPLPEQQRIAEILDRAEALRTKRRQVLEQVDTFIQAVFIAIFGDPVRNPKKWSETKRLGDVSDLVSGVTKGRDLRGRATREVPYLAVVNVQDRALDLSVVKSIQATEEEIQRLLLMPNDLLLTEGGDPDKLGRGTLWANQLPECIHQNHIFRVRLTTNELRPLFLNWLIGSQRGKTYFLKSAKQTTGIASINMTQLQGFPLLIPPIDVQEAFDRAVEAAENLKATLQSSMSKLDALFSVVQHQAFRGEL